MARTKDDWPVGFQESTLSLRLLPLAVSAIWAVTAIPVDVSSFGIDERLWRTGPRDFLGNVVLYLPLGIALGRLAWWRVVLSAAALSAIAESSQLWYPDRFTAVTDVAANTGGAFLGYVFSVVAAGLKAGRLDALDLTRRLAASSAVLFVAAIFLLTKPGLRSDFSNWDPDCRVIAGDELTRDRPWRGDIGAAAVFNRSLGEGQIRELCAATEGPVDGSGFAGTLAALSPVFVFGPVALDSIRGVPLMNVADHERFFRALVDRGELGVVVSFRPENDTQRGPARIFGFSKSPWAQNFCLGQEGRDIVFRLRTPTTVPGGFSPETIARGVLEGGKDEVVAATYDGRNVRVYVDGGLAGRLNLGARGRASPFFGDTGLPAAAFLIGALMGLVWVATARSRGMWSLIWWGTLGGGLGGACFVVAGGAETLPEFAGWVPLIGAWGGAVIGASSAPVAPGRPSGVVIGGED